MSSCFCVKFPDLIPDSGSCLHLSANVKPGGSSTWASTIYVRDLASSFDPFTVLVAKGIWKMNRKMGSLSSFLPLSLSLLSEKKKRKRIEMIALTEASMSMSQTHLPRLKPKICHENIMATIPKSTSKTKIMATSSRKMLVLNML